MKFDPTGKCPNYTNMTEMCLSTQMAIHVLTAYSEKKEEEEELLCKSTFVWSVYIDIGYIQQSVSSIQIPDSNIHISQLSEIGYSMQSVAAYRGQIFSNNGNATNQ